jgi:hypothetical protein
MLVIPPAGKIFPAGFMCGKALEFFPTMSVLDWELSIALDPQRKVQRAIVDVRYLMDEYMMRKCRDRRSVLGFG